MCRKEFLMMGLFCKRALLWSFVVAVITALSQMLIALQFVSNNRSHSFHNLKANKSIRILTKEERNNILFSPAERSNFVEKVLMNEMERGANNWYLKEPDTTANSARLVIFVQSRHAAIEEREFIRTTWANKSYYVDDVIRRPFIFFVSGLDARCLCVMENVSKEILTKRDILLIDMTDSYDNLTLKGLLGMRWILSKFGDSLKYVIKTDDDVMLNTFRWMYVLESSLLRNIPRFFLGFIWRRSPVRRTGKYVVSNESYPEHYYPSYCAGPGYAMSRDALIATLNMTSRVRYLQREDVYITGLLAAASYVTRLSFSNDSIILYEKQFEKKVVWHSTLLVHSDDRRAKRNIWREYVRYRELNDNFPAKVVAVTRDFWPFN